MASFATLESSLVSPIGDLPPLGVIFGHSEAMQGVRLRIERVAVCNVPVLIQGESGTGKEIMAKLTHHLSPWQEGPWVRIDCPAIPGTLLESELFGYEKGAFTGAYATKPGRVELAHRGTLFLDEIGELDPTLQAKLLHLLQDGQFCRIGAQEEKRAEVRVVCATNRRLEHEVEVGSFRPDLFYRINVVNITLPPLRERAKDIPYLVNYFWEYYSAKYNRPVPPPSRQMMQLLQRYEWPGNIRQLENLMRRYVILGVEEAISSELLSQNRDHFSPDVAAGGTLSLKKLTRQAVREVERKVILRALQEANWNQKKAARTLEISYRALLYKIRQAGLPTRRGGALEKTSTAPVWVPTELGDLGRLARVGTA